MAFQRPYLDAYCTNKHLSLNQHSFKASLGMRVPLLAFLLLYLCSCISVVFAALPVTMKAVQVTDPVHFTNDVEFKSSSLHLIGTHKDSLLVDSTVTGLIPALSYSTDVGLAGGLIWSKLSYGQQDPFRQNIAVTALASTKGLAGFNFFLDQPCSFNCVDRLIVNLVGNRFLEDQYYGVFTDKRIELKKNPKRFEYQSFTFKVNLEYRISTNNLAHKNETLFNSLNGFLSTDFQYKTPWSNDDTQLIMLEKPTGYAGAYGFWLGLGGLIDTRDSEFYPRQGWYSKQQVKGSLKSVLSNFTQTLFLSDTRYYQEFKLILPIVFAQRISYQWSNSNANTPYWSYPTLGGEEFLRGYVDNRFLVPQFWATNTELRTWLYESTNYGLKIGGTLFMDSGSFTDGTIASGDWSANVRYTAGFGGLVSLFSPDFILRVDLGFSEEGYGIFFSTGMLF